MQNVKTSYIKFFALFAFVVYNDLFVWMVEKYMETYGLFIYWKQWHKRSPEWFDHRIDYYQWPRLLNPHWVERGIYSKEVMFKNCRVLDIACGDGFYPKYFYVSTGAIIDAIDLNPRAIAHASKYNANKNIRYFLQNALTQPFPQKKYDVICLDGAIDHFDQKQLDKLLVKIRKSLKNKGVMTGYQEINGTILGVEHQISFSTIAELRETFHKHFTHVTTKIINSSGRINAYLHCSN